VKSVQMERKQNPGTVTQQFGGFTAPESEFEAFVGDSRVVLSILYIK
jgi:hypothetical protein